MLPGSWKFGSASLSIMCLEKLLIIENQYYLEIDQARRNLQIRCHLSRVDRSEVTSKIQGYINQLSANGDLLSFLRTAGHLMDGYYRKISNECVKVKASKFYTFI